MEWDEISARVAKVCEDVRQLEADTTDLLLRATEAVERIGHGTR